MRPDIRNAYAVDAAAEAWNQEMEQQIIIDEPAGAADQKIQAAVAAGDLIWDGFAVIEGPWGIESWVSRELIQPLDDLIAVSTVADADKVVPAIIPSVLESSNMKRGSIPFRATWAAWRWAGSGNRSTPPASNRRKLGTRCALPPKRSRPPRPIGRLLTPLCSPLATTLP
ncbi:MAG: hypothetical protein R2911_10825 [Caldilineaceae bacterium]